MNRAPAVAVCLCFALLPGLASAAPQALRTGTTAANAPTLSQEAMAAIRDGETLGKEADAAGKPMPDVFHGSAPPRESGTFSSGVP